MPPHCDTRDGPVVSAARVALDTGNVNFVLIWVRQSAENELRDVFEKTLEVRKKGPEAQALADEWFFENVVRLHRAGEGAPFTGLKPAGLDWGPVVPRAEKAIETNDATDAIGFVLRTIEDDLQQRFKHHFDKELRRKRRQSRTGIRRSVHQLRCLLSPPICPSDERTKWR